MISKLGQAMPRFLTGTSIAGEGMRERLQAATFAMFGVVTAIGLVLVGVAYNQSWPEFADSPIPGVPEERVDRASVVAGGVRGHAGSGNAASGLSPLGGRSDIAGRSPGHSSSHQLPVTVPDGQVPGPASSGPGGVGAPGSPAPAPTPQAPQPPVSAGAQPGQAAAPVAASPPAPQTAGAASVPAKGKGHEKAEKPAKPEKAEKPHGKAAPVTPVTPPPPSVPAPGEAAPEAPGPVPGPGNGNGKGNAKGHEK